MYTGKLIEGTINELAAPPHCRFTMFPSLKQRPTLALEQDALPSLSLSLFPQFLSLSLFLSPPSLSPPVHLSPYWFHLISFKGFWATWLSKKKKSYHGIFLAHSILPLAEDMGLP